MRCRRGDNIKIKFTILFIVCFLFSSGLAWAQKKAVNPNSEEDVAELIADAESGDRGAQYDLSMVYTFKQDSVNAMKWLTKSAENGYGRAQYTLGNLYYNGSDKVKRNYEKAIEWFEASKETKYKGANVNELIASAKQKMEDEKKAAVASAEAAKKKAAADAARKAKEALEAAKKAADEAAEKIAKEAREAEEAARKAAEEAAAKAEEEARQAAEASKSMFQKIKEKILSFFD